MYYFLKPILPWRLRLAVRRCRAAYIRRFSAEVWPIDARSGALPRNWRGWPNEKRFALVLTHDVEGQKGLERVPRLMELELDYGFRSCFNFVPEGDYRVPDSLRARLNNVLFEVGVHGLRHDGKLYNSKTAFAASARRIRGYLDKWNATGFRSPLMQHKLPWLHDLAVEYDTSTFDTDPFEPEPDGMGTIFPFWVHDGKGAGYVDLPYTLAQDFTLFVVLQKPDITVWKQKLDWVAERGGMVLVNTHPDYMSFDGKRAADEYPVSHYEDLLRYVREKYEGSYWAALPREVARHYCGTLEPMQRNTRKKICMLAYTNYDVDNRVRRYAETLARRGDQVDVITLLGRASQKPVEEINGVTIYRIQHREFNERNKWEYAQRLARFLLASSRFLSSLHYRHQYDVIHIHNMPDFLVFAAWYPKLTGAKLILDIHDLVPELFANKFKAKASSLYPKILNSIEKISAKFVDHVIVSNHLWRARLTARSVPAQKCSVFINHVDPAIFYQRPKTRNDGKFIILFPGSFQWHQGLDIGIKAFARVHAVVPKSELHLYGGGGGDQTSQLKQLVEELGLRESVRFCDPLPLNQIADVIANADLGIVPKRGDSFGNEAYSTKIMEFMSQGIPVVASRTKIDSYYFTEGIVHFFKSGDSNAMAGAMLDVIHNTELRKTLIEKGLEYVQANNWNLKSQEYLDLVDSLSTERFTKKRSVKDSPATPLIHSESGGVGSELANACIVPIEVNSRSTSPTQNEYRC